MTDALTGEPVGGARVTVSGSGHAVESDGRGRFRIRGLEPGRVTLVAAALGYAEAAVEVELANGSVARAELRLQPRALPVAALRVTGRSLEAAGRTVHRADVEDSGARTVGELLVDLPGVTVRSRGPGGRQVVTIRGEDAVLVLVDGVPANDPVTGEADLSDIPTSSVERVVVLPGARSTRYGPRAQGGVVLVETRSAAARPEAAVRAGSLGRTGGEARAGGRVGGVGLTAGAEYEAMDGRFHFLRSPRTGGGEAIRRNADLRRTGFHGAAEIGGALGSLRLSAGHEELERGLPGKSFAPSDSARENRRRSRATAAWRAAGERMGGAVSAYAVRQRLWIRDPAPPLGLPYDDRTRMTEVGVRGELAARFGTDSSPSELSAGLDLARRSVRSSALSSDAPLRRSDLGLWLRGEVDLDDEGPLPRLAAAIRGHRTGPAGDWHGTHELTLRRVFGSFSVHAAHRSGFSPPTLGDQYFREGVAVRSNPGLQAERVPGEMEAGVAYRGGAGPVRLDLSATAFRGDVRDMIVWAPDFRFIWSPRNVDAERSGLEARASLGLPGSGLRFTGAFTRARVVYDRDGRRDVQLRYRPRRTGSLRATWEVGGFRTALGARFVGERTTVPDRVNVLPSFWTVDLDLRKRWRWSEWEVEAAARVDRLLDRTDPFVFAFPEPGRTAELELRIRTPNP